MDKRQVLNNGIEVKRNDALECKKNKTKKKYTQDKN
jgi:hypothetical protein